MSLSVWSRSGSKALRAISRVTACWGSMPPASRGGSGTRPPRTAMVEPAVLSRLSVLSAFHETAATQATPKDFLGATESGLSFVEGRYSSKSRCALTPPKPKPLSATRLGTSGALRFQGLASVGKRNGDGPVSSAKGSGLAEAGGMTPWASAERALERPGVPAAVSRWPTTPLTDPRAHRPAGPSSPRQSSWRLSNSMASPTGVPVAWHSIQSTMPGDQPASR